MALHVAPNSRQRGLMLILSGPGGSGKTTIASLLQRSEPYVEHSVSTTSRTMRPGEQEGVNYFYVTRDRFLELKAQNYFLETTEFQGNFYGTSRKTVESILSKGHDVVFTIDYVGAQTLSNAMPMDVVRVFLLPPSFKELEQRLVLRGDAPEKIRQRLDFARQEIDHWEEYDYVFVNEELEGTLRRIKRILRAERLRRQRQPWVRDFVGQLMAE